MVGDVAYAPVVAAAASAAGVIIVADIADDIGIVRLLKLQVGQLTMRLIAILRQLLVGIEGRGFSPHQARTKSSMVSMFSQRSKVPN